MFTRTYYISFYLFHYPIQLSPLQYPHFISPFHYSITLFNYPTSLPHSITLFYYPHFIIPLQYSISYPHSISTT